MAPVLVAALATLGIAFVSLNVYPNDPPAPLWTFEDLPHEADPADNGWLIVTARHQAEIPKPLTELLNPPDHDAEKFWQQVDRQAEGLGEFLAGDAAREANQRVDRALRMPKFEATCPADTNCAALHWLGLHRIATLRAIDLAQRGEVVNATTLLRELIRVDTAHLASASSPISLLVALANLEDAFNTADMIAQRPAPSPEANAAFVELTAVVRGVDVETVELQNVVVGEYLSLSQGLAELEASSWMFNRALTLRDLNARFERRHRRAAEYDTFGALGAGEPLLEQEFGWWVRNSVGKQLLDDTTPIAASVATDVEEHLVTLREARSLLLSRPAQ